MSETGATDRSATAPAMPESVGSHDDPVAGPCSVCGVDLAAVAPDEVGPRVRADTDAMVAMLTTTPDALLRARPAPDQWSAAEYCGHVSDVFVLFADRIRDMVAHDTPTLTVWDHDRRVVQERYNEADAERLAERLTESSGRLLELARSLGPADLERDGWRGPHRRTVREVLARAVHEAHHHLQDATRAVGSAAETEQPT